MRDVIQRFRPHSSPPRPFPDAASACAELEAGNAAFARFLDLVRDGTDPIIIEFDIEDIGGTDAAEGALVQKPFAVVLGCSDARVPLEVIFRQRVNDLFVVRVAGNVLSNEGIGSIDYAVEHFHGSVKLIVVLGHTSCGAVTAAVDSFLLPRTYLGFATSHSLRSIIDRMFIAIRACAKGLEMVHGPEVLNAPGYRAALVESSVAANAALAAHTLAVAESGHGPEVMFGVYDLSSRIVQDPMSGKPGLGKPPANEDEFRSMLEKILGSASIRELLSAGGPS